jgi:hypothetical protein
MPRLSPAVSGAFRVFSYYLANRTLALEILDEVDYDCIFVEASALELVYAIFANVLEVGADGEILNASHAERRAAQWIRSYVDRSYRVEPALESWETALH